MSFFKKVQTSVARAKQSAMVAMGMSEETIDQEFLQLEQQFKDQYGKMKKLSKFVSSYLAGVKDLSAAQQGMSQMILDQYEQHYPMYRAALLYNEKNTVDHENIRQNLELKYQETFMNPLSEYLTQYKTIEDRIAERKTRMVDMDRHRAELKAMKEKGVPDPTRLQMATDKTEASSRAYNELNAELMRDIPKLLNNRFQFFDSLFANIYDGQAQYLNDSLRVLGTLQPELASINRGGHYNYMKVITDDASSAAAHPPALVGGPPVQGGPPTQQQQQLPRPPGAGAPAGYPPGAGAPAGYPPGAGAPAGYPYGAAAGGAAVAGGAAMAGGAAVAAYPPAANPAAAYPPASYPTQAAPVPTPAAAMPRAAGVKARALYPFQGQDETELTFQFNDIITVVHEAGDWWEGELNGKRGLFPGNYVQKIA